MAVIVNELEVVTDARPASTPAAGEGAAASVAASSSALVPEDVEELLRHERERAERRSDA